MSRFPVNLCSRLIAQVMSALIYLRKCYVIHRDIKPENLLLDDRWNIKLADFGWCIHNPMFQKEQVRRSTLCGTLDYLPPEMVVGEQHDESVDVWAIGILTYEFLVGRPPFEHASQKETYRRISNVICSFRTMFVRRPEILLLRFWSKM
eukprot:910079_1